MAEIELPKVIISGMASKPPHYNRFITQTSAPGAIREDKFQGRDYIVVPVVALREGVFQCSTCEGPELYLAQEFAGQVESWNGRPVTFGHPERDGALVSAGSADVHEHDVIGIIFNAELDEDKLKVEAWLDIELINDPDNGLTNAEEIISTIKRLQDGEQVEVSTGYFANVRPSTGKFNGKAYQGVQTSVLPDHLAILNDGVTGACSWKDGCGAPRLNANEDACCTDCDMFRNGLKDSVARIFADELLDNTEHGELSDTDRRRALESVLNDTEEFRFAWVIAVFSSTFVFEHNGALWRQSFNIGDDGVITLGDEMVKVRPETNFVDVKTNEETIMNKEQVVTDLIANKASKFNDDNRDWLMSLKEEQLELLSPEEEEPTAAPANEPTPVQALAAESSDAESAPADASSDDEETPVTLAEYISDAPAEVQAVLNEGVALQREQRTDLVTKILANKRCTFDKAELEAKDLAELRKLAAMSEETDYSARPGLGSLHDQSDSDVIPDAPDIFDLNAA